MSAAIQSTLPSASDYTEIAPRVWTATLQPASVTTAVIAGTQGCLVVDPGSSPEQGAAVRRAAAELSGVEVTAAVATHAHYDHSFGLRAFDELDVLGHEGLADAIAAEIAGADPDSPVRPATDWAVRPSTEFSLVAGLDLGGRWVELSHLGPGHTGSDVVVVVPDAKVVLVGDLLESAGPPWFGADSQPERWAATLDSVIGLMMAEGTLRIPGHGPAMALEDVMLQRGQVAAVADEIVRLVSAGVPVTEAAGAGTWPFPAEHIAACLPAAYQRLRADGVRQQLPLA